MRCEICDKELEIKRWTIPDIKNIKNNKGSMYWVNEDDFQKYREIVKLTMAHLENKTITFEEALRRI